MVLNANILADTFISHRYIPKEVALNSRASNTCGKINYTYISEVSFARSGKRLAFTSLAKQQVGMSV